MDELRAANLPKTICPPLGDGERLGLPEFRMVFLILRGQVGLFCRSALERLFSILVDRSHEFHAR